MEARVAKLQLLLVFGLVLSIRLPFLTQPIQGDDDLYLTEGAHAQIDPLHPKHTTYVFRGEPVDLRGHPHPPLDGWILGALIAVFGEVREIPMHAVYIVFSLIAAWSMWSLAKRFSPQPLWATLLFLAVPAFVVNGNSLEADIPFLAFWMASIALFCSGRLALSAVAMFFAALGAYQSILLTPILAVYLWLTRWDGRFRLSVPTFVIITPVLTLIGWQSFERVTTGALPAAVLAGYLTLFQTMEAKLASAAALTVHAWFIVFPALIPPAAVLAWRKRNDPQTRFLIAWIAIFFAGALIVFFAGSARYLLPMAAPVALLASRLPRKWLAAGFAAQMALSLGLAIVNYQHWDGYRRFAANLRNAADGHRVWVDGEWGLRYYLESQGALPLTKTQRLRASDIVVSSGLGYAVPVTAPLIPIAKSEIRPRLPFRLIGLDSHSGYSTSSKGLWPFGISDGVIDRVTASEVRERRPAREYFKADDPQASDYIVSGVFPDHWTAASAVILVKSPAAPMPLKASVYISDKARARQITLVLDGREVASQAFAGAGAYTIGSAPLLPSGPTATVEIRVDKTFTAPPDIRQLGVVLLGAGFAP